MILLMAIIIILTFGIPLLFPIQVRFIIFVATGMIGVIVLGLFFPVPFSHRGGVEGLNDQDYFNLDDF